MIAIKNSFKVFPIAVLGFLLLGCSAQCNLPKEKKSLEQISKTNCDAFTCVSEVDTNLQDELKKQGKRMLQIYLIRHAKPNVKKNWFYSADEARQYVLDYNSAPIIPFDSSLVSVHLRPKHTIYCSSLPRSQETALKIFGDKFPIVSDSIFREFEIRMVSASSFFKMPLGIWQAFSRGSWMLGFNHRGIESHKEAKLRAKQAAENLIKVAHDEETAVLVAHGMLNGAISKELEKEGWKLIRRQGQVNLGATILVKIVDINE
ncbi:histidine phosphatase family protein [Labilibaculum antarcticum]|uniref:Histidine phosphatase family protein n=1 Tax=Labilibaculum antarcticum TaxID=1717717 RepID=A0A1Y1CMI6_9BACT|nr:histidine phosphatase family protein [Labilibaculum antarcticum]BAX80481.1 histidine phosphatase family protein [Labilibaculum antarcticum]